MRKEGFNILLKEYKEEDWKEYSLLFQKVNIPIELENILPEDVMKVLIFLLGENRVLKWINYNFEIIDNMTPLEIIKIPNGLKVLKAFIMRIPN